MRTCSNVRQGCIVGTHIKPIHIGRQEGIQTPTELMGALHRAGWRYVVVIRRLNMLAREVSSFELAKKQEQHHKASSHGRRLGGTSTRWQNLIPLFTKMRADLDEGVRPVPLM